MLTEPVSQAPTLPTPKRRTAPSKKERDRAFRLGKRFRVIAKRKHPRVDQLEDVFRQFRQARDESRGEGGYNHKVEAPLWAAFLRGISGR